VFDVTDFVGSTFGQGGDTNLTVAFESAWTYGQNVTKLPDASYHPTVDVSELMFS
jgi:beta-mannosidase